MLKRKILLTPGPATTSDAVKKAQVVSDICPREKEFGIILCSIKADLEKIASINPENYSAVLFSGSGTAAIDSSINSITPAGMKILIINNGAYGVRMVEIAKAYKIDYLELVYTENSLPDLLEIENLLIEHKDISCIFAVHHETTTGILNPIKEIGILAKGHGCTFILDSMSSFCGIDFKMEENDIDFLISSSNKCVQGMAGISFIICKKDELEKIKFYEKRSFYLDLYEQYSYLNKKNQMRFTPPVQTIYSLRKAIDEFFYEGISNRQKRYFESWNVLSKGLKKRGFKLLLEDELQSKILTTIITPKNPKFDFNKLHDLLYSQNFTIYPGKIGELNTFRISNMGEINYLDIESFLLALDNSLDKMGIEKLEY